MTGDSCSLVSKKTRLALCDMTNLPTKRGISSILGDFLSKSGDNSVKTVAREPSGVKFSKRLCLVVDDLVKESTRTSDTTNEGSSPDDKIIFDGDSENFDVKESQGETNAVDMGVEPSKGDVSDDAVKETCEKDSNMNVCASQTDATTTGEDLAVAVFSSSNTQGSGLLLPSSSQSIKSFNMNRCSNVDGIGIVNHGMEADNELRSCPCSVCLKAAFIWSDLQYQDIKGRLSVLKKSQKEASILIQRNGKAKPMDIYGSENSNNSTNQDSDFMGQWTSLFLNMEGILARENNHLQNSFVAMKDLRENHKINLEKASTTLEHYNT